MEENIQSNGIVHLTIMWDDGRVEELEMRNRILRSGRMALANTLANNFGSAFEYFVTGITFGSGGTFNNSPRYIDDTRTGLFGPVIVSKPVISSINPDILTQVTFTSVLTFDEAVGDVVNEMALVLGSGDYFSMVTFGDINKTSSMQLIFNWRISVV